jgi:hypothetical protein
VRLREEAKPSLNDETTGYEVADPDSTLVKAQSLGVKLLVPAITIEERTSAIV